MKELFDLKRASGMAHALIRFDFLTIFYQDSGRIMRTSNVTCSFPSGVQLFISLLAYIDYQARLQHLDDRDTLSRTYHKLSVTHGSCSCFVLASASLTDLRLKEDTPNKSHRHSFSSVRRSILHNTCYSYAVFSMQTFLSWKMQRRSYCGHWQGSSQCYCASALIF